VVIIIRRCFKLEETGDFSGFTVDYCGFTVDYSVLQWITGVTTINDSLGSYDPAS